MGFNLFARKPKPKPEVKRLNTEDYGEVKYVFKHTPTLAVYREYNDTVSAPAIARDKVLKKWFAVICGVISLVMGVLAYFNFDLFEYLDKGRSFYEWISYTGFMAYFMAFLLFAYLCFHLATYYKYFPKRFEKATADYYKSSKYLTNEIVLAVYEDGVIEKAEPRDEFFEWGLFNRCWESDNVVYLEFTLANQLFVAKEVMLEAGVNIEEFIAFCNEHIEIGKKIMAERAEEDERLDDELEELEDQIDELEDELEDDDDDDDDGYYEDDRDDDSDDDDNGYDDNDEND